VRLRVNPDERPHLGIERYFFCFSEAKVMVEIQRGGIGYLFLSFAPGYSRRSGKERWTDMRNQRIL